MKTFFTFGTRLMVIACLTLFFSAPVLAEEILPMEDREIKKNYHGDQIVELLGDGQHHPGVTYVSSPEEEYQFVLRFDLSAYAGLQVGDARLSFLVEEANNFEFVSLDIWYFEGDGAVAVDDFNGGDILAGSVTYDTDANMTFTIDQWVEIDVTQLINAREGDDIYFNIRLSGGYQEGYSPNEFGSQSHHWVTLAASEQGADRSPRLSIEGPFVGLGDDRKVFDSVILDGSGSYDPAGTIVSYQWSLECRGKALYNRRATGQTATVNNLRPGFYDVYLTVENDIGQTATGGFVLLSTPQETGDMDGDGDIDGSDVAVFAEEFGQGGL